MTLRHANPSQSPEIVTLVPLLQNEDPYYKNLNRAPKNAYTYADNINKMLSYGGSVSRLRAAGSTVFDLYDIVAIVDGELIDNALAPTIPTIRYGIVVTEADEDNYYIVCTFCPNFVYPSSVASSILGFTAASAGTNLYLDSDGITPDSSGWLTTTAPSTPVILAKKTGSTSIFFCGTVRLFS